MSEIQCIRKSGRLVPYIATGAGPIERVCAMACCQNLEKWQRFTILPCGCHSTIVKCTCPVKEIHCDRCGRNFVTIAELKGKEWFEIEDPHPSTVDTSPYGIVKTRAVRLELAKMPHDKQIGWLESLKAKGPWWLWKLKSKPQSKEHIARKWSEVQDSDLIGTCCSMQVHVRDMFEVDPNHPEVDICGTCQRVAAKNGIEVGNYQPRL